MREYAAVPSIRRYVILEATAVGLLVLERASPEQAWQTTALSSGDILHMPEIGIETPAAEFYDGIEFAERTWTIIGVTDVALSFKWYQTLLDLPESEPAHDYFGQILDPDGTVILCLHKWGDHEHPSLISSPDLRPGHGLLLFFVVDNFDIALQRARASGGQLLEEPHLNPNSQGGQSLQKV